MPVRLELTEGTTADCTQAQSLTADLPAQYLLADRGYDTNAIVAEAIAQGMEPVIPPRSHRREPRYYDQDLYRLRHLGGECILKLQTMEGGGNSLCQKSLLILGYLPDSSTGPLD